MSSLIDDKAVRYLLLIGAYQRSSHKLAGKLQNSPDLGNEPEMCLSSVDISSVQKTLKMWIVYYQTVETLYQSEQEAQMVPRSKRVKGTSDMGGNVPRELF